MLKAIITVLALLSLAVLLSGCHHRSRALQPASLPPPLPPSVPVSGIRGIYLSGWAAGSPQIFADNVALIDRTTLNAMVIDVKDAGQVSYAVDVPLAQEIGANQHMIGDIDAVIATLRAHNIFPIARIACFRDTRLALAHPELAIQTRRGKAWRDPSGHAWLNPYDQRCWDYNVELALDAAKHGFQEIQFDYVRFPSEGLTKKLYYPGRPPDAQRQQQIAAFVHYARQKLHPLGVYVSVDVFGLSSKGNTRFPDMGIGQTPTNIAAEADILCPMVYPSHYGPGEYNIPDPNRSPYRTVLCSVTDSSKALQAYPTCTLRPWLQDFSLHGVSYGQDEVKAQIDALESLGIHSYLLWNARCRYTEAALDKK